MTQANRRKRNGRLTVFFPLKFWVAAAATCIFTYKKRRLTDRGIEATDSKKTATGLLLFPCLIHQGENKEEEEERRPISELLMAKQQKKKETFKWFGRSLYDHFTRSRRSSTTQTKEENVCLRPSQQRKLISRREGRELVYLLFDVATLSGSLARRRSCFFKFFCDDPFFFLDFLSQYQFH